jgi:hypothetical protein
MHELGISVLHVESFLKLYHRNQSSFKHIDLLQNTSAGIKIGCFYATSMHANLCKVFTTFQVAW